MIFPDAKHLFLMTKGWPLKFDIVNLTSKGQKIRSLNNLFSMKLNNLGGGGTNIWI